jgi:hypothetical protein
MGHILIGEPEVHFAGICAEIRRRAAASTGTVDHARMRTFVVHLQRLLAPDAVGASPPRR